MRIIDFHAHIYPDKIAEKATNATGGFYGITPACLGTSEALLREGKSVGINGFVLLPVATRPEQAQRINTFIRDEVNAHAEFHGFGTLHPDSATMLEEAEYILRSGLLGVKLHPDTQGFNTDDKRLFEVYDYLQGRGTLIVHCGDKRFDYSHPRRLKKVIDNFPKLRIIAAHLGGWSLFDEAFALLKNSGCFLDISSCTMFLPPEKVAKYICGYGADRVLFGTDFPLWSPESEVKAFQKLPLKSTEFEKIAYKNALRVID